ncbi:Root phototropism protein 2 [Acorus gramineus]|uniref:Root phototropism protein 2 n=1 Tax=Acorus gramineus TaxID=55184 RepID=A0AAV9AL01_ACOGR|nr:Root phototropism protein 2 [Acorus gramineus]
MAAASVKNSNTSRLSLTMERTGQWFVSQEFPTDIVVVVGTESFPLHKFMLVAKSGYLRRKIMESDAPDLTCLDITDVIPGNDAEVFERAAKFCYGVNFEITVHNIAAIHCVAENLEMTDDYSPGNLVSRCNEFLHRAALTSLRGAIIVLRSCEALLPLAEELGIVQLSVEALSLKACTESRFPTRSPPDWWAAELAVLSPSSFNRVLSAIKSLGATPHSLSTALSAFADHHLLLPSSASDRRTLLETIVSLLPTPANAAPLPVGFLCTLLRASATVGSPDAVRSELERRVSADLDQASVGDLLAIALDPTGERVADLEAVRRVVSGFMERERRSSLGGLLYGEGACSAAMQRVARTVDAFVGEVATDEELSVSGFASVAGALPKSARRVDDDLYRAVDIYLKAHPQLDELEREKACSVMDPLKLSYEARLHAAQNKRLPLQVMLHALYYDQLNLRSRQSDITTTNAAVTRGQIQADSSLIKENEDLRSELMKMKMYVSDIKQSRTASSSSTSSKRPTTAFFSSVTRKLGKLNPFSRLGSSKDSSVVDDAGVGVMAASAKPRRRRFSIS